MDDLVVTIDPAVMDSLAAKVEPFATELTADERALFDRLLTLAGVELDALEADVEGYQWMNGVTVTGSVGITGTFGGPKGNRGEVSWSVDVTATANPGGLPKGWRPK